MFGINSTNSNEKRISNSSLIFVFAFLGFTFDGIAANLFVILLEGSQILTSFGEFAFFHTFTDIPVDESTLGVPELLCDNVL